MACRTKGCLHCQANPTYFNAPRLSFPNGPLASKIYLWVFEIPHLYWTISTCSDTKILIVLTPWTIKKTLSPLPSIKRNCIVFLSSQVPRFWEWIFFLVFFFLICIRPKGFFLLYDHYKCLKLLKSWKK